MGASVLSPTDAASQEPVVGSAQRVVVTYHRTTFDDFVGWTTHHTVSSVACNSDFEKLAALQAVETVIHTKDIVLTPISFRCSRWVGSGKGFVAI